MNGRLANVPSASNARFYADRNLAGATYFDPKTNSNVTVYPFNNVTPLSGDAVPENALGYLMRNTQWLVQPAGVVRFRVHATKNMDDTANAFPAWGLGDCHHA